MDKNQWDLSSLLQSDNDPAIKSKREEITKKCNQFIEKWTKNEGYLNNPQTLTQALKEYEELHTKYWPFGDEAFYFSLKSEKHQTDPNIRAKYNDVVDFATNLENSLQFFELNIAKISQDKQSEFLSYKDLEPYHHFLERNFAYAAHLLSDAEEKILNLKSPVSYSNWVDLTSGLLSKEEAEINGETKHFSEIVTLQRDKDKATRDQAATEFNRILAKWVDVAESEINSVLMDKKINDQLRHFATPLDSRLLSDDIKPQTVEVMRKTVTENFEISNKFYELKAKLLGVPKLQYHERNVEVGESAQKFTYDQAKDIISTVFAQIDPEFKDIYQNFVDHNQIDVFPQKGKRSGAFCSGNLLTQPTYILLNYTDTLTDVTTFAHELGHGINNELMRKKQNSLNFGTSLATAEVASTFFEDFVIEHLEQETNEDRKLSLLISKLDSDISSIFRQIACFNFEIELHNLFRQKFYLSKEEIGKIFQKHMASYMGDYVEQSAGSENWWVYWSHIRVYFYNYSYANGLLISKALQAIFKKDHQNIDKIKYFLSAGLSASPEDTFSTIDVNISNQTFWQNGINRIKNNLQRAEELAQKLNKI